MCGEVKFLETIIAYVKDTPINIRHRVKPWHCTSFRVAQPSHSTARARTYNLAGEFMRACTNSWWGTDAMAAVAELAREAYLGANFSKSMIRRAYNHLTNHEQFKQTCKNFHKLMWACYDGLGPNC